MLLNAADWLVYGLLGIDPNTRFGGAVQFFVYDSMKIFLLLAGMIFIIGVLRTFLPERKLREWMGRGGVWGNVIAAVFGAVTPFCSCSSIPIFIGFLRAGVPLGICFSFLITSPIINEYLVVLMAADFGIPITLVYVGSGLLIGVVAGFVLGKLKMEKHLEDEFAESSVPESRGPENFRERIRFAVGEVVGVIRAIWIWVLVGVAIGSFLHNYVPQETIHRWMEMTGVFSVPIATFLGVPLYGSCAAIVPVAVVLFEKGIPIGTALSFMMAMSALSLPEAVMLRRTMKLPLIALFFAITAGAIMATGYLLNALARFL
ncbi:permease [Puniceicoccus vermicola]|uniref:Permease n=1 Tax=Puniceicoccus vermicola TaxID=388746 RepID=A0A7X1B1Q6_9BACT|nr:permease [Puniceicoccus vermicola]MBC2604016.1 permease [Puniceicoccus vermicola]